MAAIQARKQCQRIYGLGSARQQELEYLAVEAIAGLLGDKEVPEAGNRTVSE